MSSATAEIWLGRAEGTAAGLSSGKFSGTATAKVIVSTAPPAAADAAVQSNCRALRVFIFAHLPGKSQVAGRAAAGLIQDRQIIAYRTGFGMTGYPDRMTGGLFRE